MIFHSKINSNPNIVLQVISVTIFANSSVFFVCLAWFRIIGQNISINKIIMALAYVDMSSVIEAQVKFSLPNLWSVTNVCVPNLWLLKRMRFYKPPASYLWIGGHRHFCGKCFDHISSPNEIFNSNEFWVKNFSFFSYNNQRTEKKCMNSMKTDCDFNCSIRLGAFDES